MEIYMQRRTVEDNAEQEKYKKEKYIEHKKEKTSV